MVLKSENPGIVIVEIIDEKIMEISISDLNRELGKFQLSMSSRIEGRGENYKSVWNSDAKVSDLSIDLPKGVYAGNSITIKL